MPRRVPSGWRGLCQGQAEEAGLKRGAHSSEIRAVMKQTKPLNIKITINYAIIDPRIDIVWFIVPVLIHYANTITSRNEIEDHGKEEQRS